MNSVSRSATLFFALVLALAACGSTVASDEAASDEVASDGSTGDDAVGEQAANDDAAGGDDSNDGDSSSDVATGDDVDTADATAADPATGDQINGGKPVVEVPAGDAPTELGINDLIPGSGKEAAPGDFLVMHYVGVLHADGEQFDASWDRGSTFDFILGQGRVIQGWDEGIVGMKVGGRRLLNIPSAQAYGPNGQGGIPADSALVFVVDLVNALTPPTVENAPAPVTELEVTVLEEGDGPVIAEGSVVEMHYRALLQTTGEVFDSSWEGGQPIVFQVGTEPSQTILGWDQGLLGKRGGDTVRLVIPPELGIDDPSGTIPADATIITEVTILSVVG